MVNNGKTLAGLIALLVMMAHADARTVKFLKIESTGLTDEKLKDEAAARACRKFKPTKNQVISFFNKAYPVESYVLSQERYSPCQAVGVLKFSDGSTGNWVLYSSGVAVFTFERGDVVYFFSKPNKWHDPNACTYGLGEKGVC